MRTIDADAALKALRKCQTYLYDARDPELKIELSSAEAAINNLPTIQPEKTQFPKESITSDLISRQAAIDAFEDTTFTKNEIRRRLSDLPPVQPERAEGEWVLKDYLWECNKCGCRINVKNPLCENDYNYFFCPHCGTKMIIAVQRF